jgi:hypothetical protein
MKNVNKTVVLVGIVLLNSISHAQRSDWTLGFHLKSNIQTLEKTNLSGLEIKTISVFAEPSMELNLTYNITKKLSIGSGIAYLKNEVSWETLMPDKWMNNHGGSLLLASAQVPFFLKYAIPLGKSNFSFYGKFGFMLDIPVYELLWARPGWVIADDYSTMILMYDEDVIYYNGWSYFGSSMHEYKQTKFYDKKINVLLNTGLGFEYRLKKGIGLSFDGEYYAGFRTMGVVLIEVKPYSNCSLLGIAPSREHSELLQIKGNYWNFRFGISYNFKKTEKKKEINPHWENVEDED